MKEQQPDYENVFPSVMNRVQAVFFDLCIMGFLVYILATLRVFGVNHFTGIYSILFVILLFVYEPICNLTGGTLGYRTMGLRVKQFGEPGKNISIYQAYMRFLAKFFLGWLSFLSIHMDPFRRAIHDKVSGTVVIQSR